jgi:hypothetical protein
MQRIGPLHIIYQAWAYVPNDCPFCNHKGFVDSTGQMECSKCRSDNNNYIYKDIVFANWEGFKYLGHLGD